MMHRFGGNQRRWSGVAVLLCVLSSLAAPAPLAADRNPHIADNAKIRFAAEMARRGSWREARFRWEQLLRDHPEDHRVLNNLGVACEVLGDPEQARDYYAKARTQQNKIPEPIWNNGRRFERFWHQTAPESEWTVVSAEAAVAEDAGSGKGKKKRKKGKTWEVPVKLPVPARLKLAGNERLLVASFLHRESDLFDTNRELVRFSRRELAKGTELKVLDINPPPAVPEQTLEDLIANAEFWRFLGREHDADLVVSGVLRYESGDASTFKDLDVISPTTGQKTRSTQFVEQEEFIMIIDLLFMNGRSGELLFRDRLQRAAVYPGLANDPFTAFYALGDTIVGDLLAVVTPQRRTETRWIYR